MKKHIKIGTILLLVILLTSIVVESALSGPVPQRPPGEIRIGAQDNGGKVRLGEDNFLAVGLEANLSTGYAWEVAVESAGILQMVGEDFVPESDLLGAPGIQTLHFLARAKDVTTLNLVYRRPWEEGVAPAKEFRLQVETMGPFTGEYTPPAAPAAVPSDESLDLGDDQPLLPDEEVGALPAKFNWCKKGKCTPIKNQGACGSCWAFATVGVFESAKLIKGQGEKDLSEQHLVSCNKNNWDCDGGWFAHDYHWNKGGKRQNKPGARYERQFPYKARDLRCKRTRRKNRLTGWTYVGNSYSVPSVKAIKRAIRRHGPVAVAVCVNSAFQSYSGGVFKGPGCTDKNHAVILVGWNNSNRTWKLRNSWGTGWGEYGYMNIRYGTSEVGYGANWVDY